MYRPMLLVCWSIVGVICDVNNARDSTTARQGNEGFEPIVQCPSFCNKTGHWYPKSSCLLPNYCCLETIEGFDNLRCCQDAAKQIQNDVTDDYNCNKRMIWIDNNWGLLVNICVSVASVALIVALILFGVQSYRRRTINRSRRRNSGSVNSMASSSVSSRASSRPQVSPTMYHRTTQAYLNPGTAVENNCSAFTLDTVNGLPPPPYAALPPPYTVTSQSRGYNENTHDINHYRYVSPRQNDNHSFQSPPGRMASYNTSCLMPSTGLQNEYEQIVPTSGGDDSSQTPPTGIRIVTYDNRTGGTVTQIDYQVQYAESATGTVRSHVSTISSNSDNFYELMAIDNESIRLQTLQNDVPCEQFTENDNQTSGNNMQSTERNVPPAALNIRVSKNNNQSLENINQSTENGSSLSENSQSSGYDSGLSAHASPMSKNNCQYIDDANNENTRVPQTYAQTNCNTDNLKQSPSQGDSIT